MLWDSCHSLSAVTTTRTANLLILRVRCLSNVAHNGIQAKEEENIKQQQHCKVLSKNELKKLLA